MPETADQYHRLPGSEVHANPKIRTITLSGGKGIKALYCVSCGEIGTYTVPRRKARQLKTRKGARQDCLAPASARLPAVSV